MRAADGLETIVRMHSNSLRITAVTALMAAAVFAGSASAADDDQPHFANTQVFGLKGGPHGAATSASLKITKCASSPVLANRRFFVQAHMLPVTGTQTMQLRFRFFMKQTGTAEREVKVAGSVGYWEAPVSARTVKNWIFNKQVDSLPAPASFRMEVDFQWNGTGTRVLKRQTIRTGGCTQTDMRPDLVVTSVVATSVPSTGKVHYAITVKNAGKGSAAASKILVTLLSPYKRVEVATPTLKVGESKVIGIDTDRCDSGGTALIEVDPANLLGEASTTNNSPYNSILGAS